MGIMLLLLDMKRQARLPCRTGPVRKHHDSTHQALIAALPKAELHCT
jgi:hypothetical protein